jgi:putative flavoprotein involved in K+ transport
MLRNTVTQPDEASDGDGQMVAEPHEVLIVGAGAAGLAAATALRRRGVEPLLLDCDPRVGTSWRARYDGLRLNADRWMARLPGSPPPRHRWPARDEYAAYLDAQRARHRLEIRFATTVQRIERAPSGWLLHTDRGLLAAPFLVVATGRDREPVLPEWPGREGFEGRLIHAFEYLGVAPFAGLQVLVVGAGNSATEIAMQLATVGGARVQMSVRTPPNLFPDHIFSIPSPLWARAFEPIPPPLLDPIGRWIMSRYVDDLSDRGLQPAPLGIGSEMRHKGLGPVIDRGFSDAVRAGAIEIVAAVSGFANSDVLLVDGTRVRPQAVIAATGYRFGLEGLVGDLGVLDASGRPTARDGDPNPAAPGLFFNGYRLALAGQLPEMRRAGRRIARTIAGERRRLR